MRVGFSTIEFSYFVPVMEDKKRILLIGGPGSGKTTLIQHMESQGLLVHHEISRQVILEAQEKGIDQLFLTDPLAFSNSLLAGRINQFNNAVSGLNFYDRGIPDVPAYHVFTGDPIPDDYLAACNEYIYDMVFLLPPWKEIYQSDNERYETFEQAQTISDILKEFYERFNYKPIVIPKGTIEERYSFLISQIND
ncbi:MAG: AAA family ATPase [Nonlabens sp.]|uniref:AAA family ATPase n=1 Tax=Nonlabens sp. TaxID=1888209 RepID=UPI003EF5B833